MNLHVFWLSDHIAGNIEPHTHDFYQIIYVKNSGGRITVLDKSYKAKQDHVYFVTPGKMHSITQNGDMHIVEIKFFVYDKELDRQFATIPSEFQLENVALMKMLMLHIAKEGIERKSYCTEIVNSALTLLLSSIVHQFNNAEPAKEISYQVFFDPPEYARNYTDVTILNLKSFIDENYNKDLTLDILCEKVNLNKTYFVKRFKILFGISPMKYIFDTRIKRAKQLLLDGGVSVQRVSEEVGFNSIHHFSAAFKKSEGVSPSEYRNYFNRTSSAKKP